jgi:hypothetical protein
MAAVLEWARTHQSPRPDLALPFRYELLMTSARVGARERGARAGARGRGPDAARHPHPTEDPHTV